MSHANPPDKTSVEAFIPPPHNALAMLDLVLEEFPDPSDILAIPQ